MKTAPGFAAVSIGLFLSGPAADAQSPPPPESGGAPEATNQDAGDENGASPSRMEYFELESKVLKLKLNVGVYVPPGYDQSEERYPSLYFLHGLWGNARKWEERHTDARLDELIEEGKVGPMLVVCPDGMNSMYVNAIDGKGDWCDFLATELVETIDSKYRTKAGREWRGVNGDSMGGYGALNLVLKHPDVFASVSAHSAAVYPVDPKRLPDRIQQFAANWKPVYDWPINEDHWKEWNPLALVETLPEETLKQVAIYFDCGDRDRYGFDQTNKEMHEILEKRGIPHTWHLRSGGHGADYFSTYVGEAFQFHGELFDAAATAGAKKSEEPAR